LRKILIPLARRNKREIFALPNDTNGIGGKIRGVRAIVEEIERRKDLFKYSFAC
jgi:hypothetical protein